MEVRAEGQISRRNQTIMRKGIFCAESTGVGWGVGKG